MEGRKIKKSQPPTLAVLQEFAGGRLEMQLWSRAYELAAPTGRVVASKIRIADGEQPSGRAEVTVSAMAKELDNHGRENQPQGNDDSSGDLCSRVE